MDKTNWIRIRRVKNRFINVPLEGFSAGNPGGALQLAATSATVHHGTAADKRVQRRTLSTRR